MLKSQHLIFLGQLIQTIAMTIHYILIGSDFDPLFLLQEYFMTVQYSLVFYYFVSQLCDAFTILTKFYKIKVPLIIINGLMLIGFALYVGINAGLGKALYNCNNGIWVYLHCCNILLGIGFVAIGRKASNLLKINNNKNLLINNEKIKEFW